MFINSLTVKQFRCFSSKTIHLSSPLVLIKGKNGSGKTSLLEALHYSCYLRSFRTRTTRELIQFDQEAFSVKIGMTMPTGDNLDLQIGYSPAKRLIKLNETPIQSYKDLINAYRVISITDEDLLLIKGPPEGRRLFLDTAVALSHPDYMATTKRYAHVLDQRNALLQHMHIDYEVYRVWTEQLIAISQEIREKRIDLIKKLEARVNELLHVFFNATFTITLSYKKKDTPHENHDLYRAESIIKHSLIGAHLDDCVIMINHAQTSKGVSTKLYASRGQQKLAAILLKLAQPAINNSSSLNYSFLLDDVLSDLDKEKLEGLFQLLMSFNTQLILTAPRFAPEEGKEFKKFQTIDLTI